MTVKVWARGEKHRIYIIILRLENFHLVLSNEAACEVCVSINGRRSSVGGCELSYAKTLSYDKAV